MKSDDVPTIDFSLEYYENIWYRKLREKISWILVISGSNFSGRWLGTMMATAEF